MSKTNLDALIGQPVNLAEFARLCWWEGEGTHLRFEPIERDADGLLRPHQDAVSGEWHLGLEWEAPRDVRRVVVRFATSNVPQDVRAQYWRKNWPTVAPERRPGARRGWIGRDDPWHGEWQAVRAARTIEGGTCTFVFDPVDLAELRSPGAAEQLEQAEHYLARFRRTLKLRIVGSGPDVPLVAGIEAYSTATWREGRIDVRFGVGQGAELDWSGRAKAHNGRVLGVRRLDASGESAPGTGSGRVGSTPVGAGEGAPKAEPGSTFEVPEKAWRSQVRGAPVGVRLHVLHTDAGPGSSDAALVTVYTEAHSFTFDVGDLDRGPIYIPDYGVYVTWAETGPSFEAFQAQLASAARSIYDRVPDEPEQSLARAMAEIPPLDVTKQAPFGRYLPLGVEAGRQEFALRYNGELFVDKRLLKLSGRDAVRLLYPGHLMRFRFGTGDPPDFRERRGVTQQSLLGGWLPVVTGEWLDREIEYAQTAFVGLLDGPMTGPDLRRGDEDVVAMVRFRIRNTTPGRKRARLWIAIAPQEQLELRKGADGADRASVMVVATGRAVPAEPVARQWRVDPYAEQRLRCVVDTRERGVLTAVPFADESGASLSAPTAVAYDVDLEGGEVHEIDLAVPFVTLTSEAERQKAAQLDFEAMLADAIAYWRGYVESGGQMDLPGGQEDPSSQILSDFHKAVRVHVAVSADKEPANGLYSVPAATWAYGCCANEACWQIAMLDQAGHHDRAEAYLETYLRTQGQTPLDGRFASAEGVMQGVDLDDGRPRRSGFSYNLDPGFIMQTLAEHYRYTGDQAWLERATPNLIAACEFVIRERRATQINGLDGEPVVQWGLLPAGHLEDNPEWRYWFAVNAHAYAPLAAIAGVLAEVEHPEAERLLAEAATYREDIRRAARRAMVRAPVVRLLDGTYVPHVPTRARIRGREWGWFREAAYGALHLLEGGVFDPDEIEMTWVLKDLEDNLFVSRDWGRPVDLERYWFSHGGVTIQPNLQDLGIDYLRRGQIQHALRALFNNFGASLYPDVRAFTEHPVVELGHGVGPFYKVSDESKALVWLRAFLLHEEGETLHLAMGAPRAWFEPGKSFGVRGMASFFGPVSYRVESDASRVTVHVELDERRAPQELMVHLRLSEGRAIQGVTVNGRAHAGVHGEAVHVSSPAPQLKFQAVYA
jgi:hypothetical protein